MNSEMKLLDESGIVLVEFNWLNAAKANHARKQWMKRNGAEAAIERGMDEINELFVNWLKKWRYRPSSTGIQSINKLLISFRSACLSSWMKCYYNSNL